MLKKYVMKMKRELKSVGISKHTPVEYIKTLAKDCEKCGHCCSYGSGYFVNEDIDRISKKLGIKKEKLKQDFLVELEIFNSNVHKAKLKNKDEKPFGPCIFFDEQDGCTIHEIKPLHCSLSKGCGSYGEYISEWFTLNYLVKPHDPESIRQWAQYLKTCETIPGGQLHELVPDKDKLSKILNYEIIK